MGRPGFQALAQRVELVTHGARQVVADLGQPLLGNSRLPVRPAVRVAVATTLAIGVRELLSPTRWFWAVMTDDVLHHDPARPGLRAARSVQRRPAVVASRGDRRRGRDRSDGVLPGAAHAHPDRRRHRRRGLPHRPDRGTRRRAQHADPDPRERPRRPGRNRHRRRIRRLAGPPRLPAPQTPTTSAMWPGRGRRTT